MHPRSRRTPTARRRPGALACAAVTLAALLTACGSSGGSADDGPKDLKGPKDSKGQEEDERTAAPGGSRSGAPVITPTATAPIPRGKGSKLPDDLNGDGYPELALPLVGSKEETQPTRLGPQLPSVRRRALGSGVDAPRHCARSFLAPLVSSLSTPARPLAHSGRPRLVPRRQPRHPHRAHPR
ncbi:hypothetical protein ACFV2X_29785 [Streptomyces sp. NPDC059679]|uniref:hypothetical protein n=1 Tax=Streptomyces sp. NPDC059679 TaxID=3346903 RepID=UPI0036749A9D